MARKTKNAPVATIEPPQPQTRIPEKAAGSRDLLIAVAAIVLAVAFVFTQTGGFGLVGLDDTTFTTDNVFVTSGLTANGVQYAFRSFEMGSWHPLTWMSHMLDYSLFGEDPGAFHLENAAIHLANCLLLFFLARGLTGGVWPAAFLALLFALHPMHVEPVAWLADRKGLLATLFWLAAAMCWVRWAAPGGPRDRRFYFGALASFALGLLSKPTIVTLPFTLLLIEYWPLKRWTSWGEFAGRLPDKIPFFALAIGFAGLTYHGQQEAGAMTMYGDLGPGARLVNAAYGFAMYLAKTFWPAGLALNYPITPNPPMAAVAAGGAAAIGVSAVALWKMREWPALFAGWFWFLGTLIPTIGLIQTGDQAFADRYSYAPHIGLFAVVIAAVVRFVPSETLRSTGALAAGIALMVGLAWRSHVQTTYWHDAITQFEHTVSVAPAHTQGRQVLGKTYIKLKRYGEAEKHLTAGLATDPSDAVTHRTIAEVWFARGDKEKALASLDTAQRLAPLSALTQYNRGIVLRALDRYDESAAAYRKAIELGLLPETRAEAWFAMGMSLNKANKTDKAIEAFLEALKVDPYHYLARKNLAFAYLRLQDYVQSQREFELLLRTNETDPDVVRSLSFLRNRR
ncbi:MAG: tetratricopeptide repeat protein [Bryobacteraceae bacterium]